MTPIETCIAALRSGPTDAFFKAVEKAARDTVGHKLFTLLYVAPNGKRRTLGLGRVGGRDAERCADDVESLNDLAKLGRRPSGDLLERVDRFASDVKRKLVAYGVLPAELTDEHQPTESQ